MTKVTLKYLADQLNISKASVSRALNDKPGVSPIVRQRVLSLAAEVKYASNVAARSLTTSKTQLIALINPSSPEPLPSMPAEWNAPYDETEILTRSLAGMGYHLVVSTVDPEIVRDARELPLIREKRVDGVLLNMAMFQPAFVLSLKMTGIPFVLLDNTLPESPVDCVLYDDEQAGYLATRHLIQHGRRRIIALSGPLCWPSSNGRCRGYQRALAEAGLEACIFYQYSTLYATGRAAMEEALALRPDVDAVFAINDPMALGAMRLVEEHNRRVPEDIAFIGVDDIWWAAYNKPSLTTVQVHKDQMMVMAADRIVNMLRYPGQKPVRIIVSAELVVRESCGCSAPEK